MTTLERIAALTEALNSCTANNVCAVTIRKPLEDLRADLEAQLRAETARTAGTAGITRTVTRILNGMKKEPREALRYAWIDKNDRQCICTGYIAFRFTKHLPLPPAPNGLTPIDLNAIFPANTDNHHRITTPAIADVKMCIANAKAAKCTALFDLGDNEPNVDAKLLLDVLNAMPDCEMYTLNSSKRAISPIYIRNANGDGVLLPVRTQDKVIVEEQPKPNEEARRELRRIIREYNANAEADSTYGMDIETFTECIRLHGLVYGAA